MPSFARPTPNACCPTQGVGSRRLLRALAWAVLAGVGGTVGLPRVVLAAESPDGNALRRAEAIAIEARILFYQKLYAEAAERFLEAFALVPRTALLYNAARSYEEARNYAKALALFKHYVTLPDVPADGKADAQARIAVLEKLAEAAKHAPPGPSKGLDGKLPDGQGVPQDRGLLPFEPVGTRDRPPQVTPPKPSFPWVKSAAAVGLAGGATVAWLVALDEAAQAHDLEPHIQSTKDRDAYLAHADAARTWQGVAIGTAVAGVGLAGWAAWDLLRSQGPATTQRSWQRDLRLVVAPLGSDGTAAAGWSLGATTTF